ncbi:MAG: hypothetical protein P8171_14890 [Candidatus Thiodiazotropha sp.]|jgi:hypothetical protein
MRNPVIELPEMLATLAERIPPLILEHGCPLQWQACQSQLTMYLKGLSGH